MAVTAMIGVAATDGEDEALTDALDGASTVQNKSVLYSPGRRESGK